MRTSNVRFGHKAGILNWEGYELELLGINISEHARYRSFCHVLKPAALLNLYLLNPKDYLGAIALDEFLIPISYKFFYGYPFKTNITYITRNLFMTNRSSSFKDTYSTHRKMYEPQS